MDEDGQEYEGKSLYEHEAEENGDEMEVCFILKFSVPCELTKHLCQYAEDDVYRIAENTANSESTEVRRCYYTTTSMCSMLKFPKGT